MKQSKVTMRPLLALACSSLLVLAGQAVGQACNAGIEYFELEGFITAATISDGALGGPIALFSANEEQLPLISRILSSRGRGPTVLSSGNNILFLETADERILFDTGNGPMSAFGAPGQLVGTLEAQGIGRETITRVLLSHAHSDHIAGLLLDGNATLAFPGASVHMARAEFDYWMGAGPPFSDSDLGPERIAGQEASIAPVLEQLESIIELFEIGDEVLPNITAAFDAPWHTPGHTVFRIDGGAGPPVFFLGDSVVDEQLGFTHPYIQLSFDTDQAAAPAGRVELLAAIAADSGLVVPSHVQFPALGRVLPSGVYFEFARVPPSTSGGVGTVCPNDAPPELGVM